MARRGKDERAAPEDRMQNRSCQRHVHVSGGMNGWMDGWALGMADWTVAQPRAVHIRGDGGRRKKQSRHLGLSTKANVRSAFGAARFEFWSKVNPLSLVPSGR